MAIPLCYCGFEEPDIATITARGWVTTGTPIPTTAQRARTVAGFGGNQSLEILSAEAINTPTFNTGTPTTSRWFFHRVYFASTGTTVVSQTFRLAGSDQYTIQFNPLDGTIVHRRGGTAGTVVRTDPYPWVLGRWYLVEISLDAANAGSCSVYVNRSATSSSTFAGDTQNLGSAGWDQIRFSVNAGSAQIYIDDVLVFNSATGRAANDWYCLPLVRPDGAGTVTGLASSSGNPNYQNVDEAGAPTTADYNRATAAGHLDYYQYAAMAPTGAGAFLGIAPLMYASIDNTGAITQARGVIQSGASPAAGAYQTITGLFQYVLTDDFFDVDPATAVAWTEAGINAAEAGVQFN